VPITKPKFDLALEAVVAPVPPSPTASVPVIELAARSTAISEDSITSPPFDLRSTDNVFPDFCKPSAAVI